MTDAIVKAHSHIATVQNVTRTLNANATWRGQVLDPEGYRAALLAEIDAKIKRTGAVENFRRERESLQLCSDTISKAPASVAKRLAAATYHVATSAFVGEFQGNRSLVVAAMREAVGLRGRPNWPICPAYPLELTGRQSQLAMGKKPTDILPGLTNKEAHQALVGSRRFRSALHYILRDVENDKAAWATRDVERYGYGYGGQHVETSRGDSPWDRWILSSIRTDIGHIHGDMSIAGYRERIEIARWLATCFEDEERKTSLLQQRVGRRVGGRYIDRLDEIRAGDLQDGILTGIARAFTRADERAVELDRARAATDARFEIDSKKVLREFPAWYKPIRCATLLLTRDALAKEGRDMHHCVGDYSYRVSTGESFIVAIRVPSGPRAKGGIERWSANSGIEQHDTTTGFKYIRSTAELDARGTIRQHRGSCNADPHILCRLALDVCISRWFNRPIARDGGRRQQARMSQANLNYLRRNR
jgi:PcfJ-like protein